eukprot:gnl/MRDRNA2_/MRDRNA2_188369_c0_seq1.p1 gnl/MRDRNA2_/MRDRNA2_188369_c0~~gnl/MRDRNA2_/MRDRNA2_188369_c0_seq1.p1  ORF type:complete len:415 (-),score=83.18 gnl/MRDRNA2_/MRDRNA2_188369_c0_seq1:24-1268(-)
MPKLSNSFRGKLADGGDIAVEMMTVEDAKRKAAELPGCKGFCFEGHDNTEDVVNVFFKDKWVYLPRKGGEDAWWTTFEVINVNNSNLFDELPEDLPAACAEPADQGQEVRRRGLTCMDKLGVIPFIFQLAGALPIGFGISDLLSGSVMGYFMLSFGIVWHFMASFLVLLFDPGQVMAFLRSLREEGINHTGTAEIINGLRCAPPRISLNGVASHTEGGGQGGSQTVNTFSNPWYFKYAWWRDVSGPIAGLDRYRYVTLAVEVELIPADEMTKEAIERAKQDILEYIKENHKDETMTCNEVYNVANGEFKIEKDFGTEAHSKIIATCRPGVKPVFFMRPLLYFICILLFLWPLYWIFFSMFAKRMVYCLRKEISIGTDAMQVLVPSSKSETNATPGSLIEITSQTCSATTYGAKA